MIVEWMKHTAVGLWPILSLQGGAADPGERLGVHVEREARLHPHLPLQPGHRAQGRGPRQTAPAEQGNTVVVVEWRQDDTSVDNVGSFDSLFYFCYIMIVQNECMALKNIKVLDYQR